MNVIAFSTILSNAIDSDLSSEFIVNYIDNTTPDIYNDYIKGKKLGVLIYPDCLMYVYCSVEMLKTYYNSNVLDKNFLIFALNKQLKEITKIIRQIYYTKDKKSQIILLKEIKKIWTGEKAI